MMPYFFSNVKQSIFPILCTPLLPKPLLHKPGVCYCRDFKMGFLNLLGPKVTVGCSLQIFSVERNQAGNQKVSSEEPYSSTKQGLLLAIVSGQQTREEQRKDQGTI